MEHLKLYKKFKFFEIFRILVWTSRTVQLVRTKLNFEMFEYDATIRKHLFPIGYKTGLYFIQIFDSSVRLQFNSIKLR